MKNTIMYKWKIKIILNCGKEIVGQVECDHKTSMDVAEEILSGESQDFYAIGSLDHKKQIFIKIGDVSSMSVSILEE